MFTSWQRFGEVQQVPTGNLNLMIRNFSWGDKVVVGIVCNVQCSGCVFTDRCRYTVQLYIVCIVHGFEREDEETEERVISHTWLFQLMKRGLQGQGTGLQ